MAMLHHLRGWGRIPIIPRPLTEAEQDALSIAVAEEAVRLQERAALMGVASAGQMGEINHAVRSGFVMSGPKPRATICSWTRFDARSDDRGRARQ